jgi:hypothetical protein
MTNASGSSLSSSLSSPPPAAEERPATGRAPDRGTRRSQVPGARGYASLLRAPGVAAFALPRDRRGRSASAAHMRRPAKGSRCVTCKPRRPGVGSCEADARDGCAGRMIPQSILEPAGRVFVASAGPVAIDCRKTSRQAAHRNDDATPRGRLSRPRPPCTAAQNADGAGARFPDTRLHHIIFAF